MDYCVSCGTRTGQIAVPASKSYAHRLLISAALGDRSSVISCDGISKDIQATIDCLNALGAHIIVKSNIINVTPIDYKTSSDDEVVLPCNESGSTLRFLIPLVGALGKKAAFRMEGKLSERPLDELKNALSEHGMSFLQSGQVLKCGGKLTSGTFLIPGNISSQYISGLLFALPLLAGDSRIKVTGKTESEDYIKMTIQTITSMDIVIQITEDGYFVKGNQTYSPTHDMKVEKDWSNAAFFVCMGAMSRRGIGLEGMNIDSAQGDKRILEIVKLFGAKVGITDKLITVRKGDSAQSRIIDASTIPDLVPTIAALASVSEGKTTIVNARRLRFKESDRLMTTSTMLRNLGAEIAETDDGLIINGRERLAGGETETFNDHRIAMAAAVAAGGCMSNVIIKGCECTSKSYPMFFEDFEKLEEEI